MQIVIDISDKTYAEKDNPSFSVRAILEILQAVRNGTPLPKGHGRLIDADNLQKKYCDDNCGKRKCVDAMDRCVFIDAVLDAQTIIEADKEGKDAD